MSNIEGPYSFKAVDGLKTPVYIYKPGAIRQDVGEVTVKVDGKMTFDVKLDEEHKDVEMASFEVPMRYTYVNRPDTPRPNWGYNCLTTTVHHGRPEAIWKLPLRHAAQMFGIDGLKQIVVARIRNDAQMFVDHSIDVPADLPFELADMPDKLAELAEFYFLPTFGRKLTEINDYYDSIAWRKDVEEVIVWLQEDRLNPHYQPLHSHDSINMLCRILGQSVEYKLQHQKID